ncbi:MAG TPA: HAD family hydrolase [Candidatus Binataceae bacterium]|nr:HAD family hydrolase [Candidatus Binataceae bacterium]
MTSAAQPTLWLFDFDTTLARLEPVVDWPAVRAEVRTILERAGAPRRIIEQVPQRSLSMYEGYRAYLSRARPSGGAAVLARVSKLIEKYELAGVDRAAPLDGAIGLLRAIAALGLGAGIVTSNSSVTVMRWLSRYRIAAAVGFIVGRDSELPLKPSPAMLLRALELGGVRARDAILVGDSDADLIAARAARMRFIAVASDDSARDRLIGAGAAEIYSSPAALAIHLNLAAPRPQGGITRGPKSNAGR